MRLRVLAILATVIATVAGTAWFVALPAWRPALRPGERYGIDVSAHQGLIDWAAVERDGIGFAYIKATEGNSFTDSRFRQNWRAAKRVGLDRGAYHFFSLCAAGATQAQHFIRVAPPSTDVLAPAVDLELKGNCRRRPPVGHVRAEVMDFVAGVENAWGRPVVLYVGDEFERRYPGRSSIERPLWVRRFLVRPSYPRWIVWQLHGFARVRGVRGRVDLDVMRS